MVNTKRHGPSHPCGTVRVLPLVSFAEYRGKSGLSLRFMAVVSVKVYKVQGLALEVISMLFGMWRELSLESKQCTMLQVHWVTLNTGL